MYYRVYSLLCKYKLINTNQFGFGSNHSTEHVLISFIETIKKYLDNDEVVCSCTFTCTLHVNHEALLEKLKHYGIISKENNWFRSCLINRKQYVSTWNYNTLAL